MGKKIKCIAALFVLVAALLMTGCASVDATVGTGGAGTATVTVSASEGMTSESVRSKLDEFIKGVDALTGEEGRISVRSVQESNEGFAVSLSFKNPHLTKGAGDFNFMKTEDFLKEINKTALVKNWEKGKFGTLQMYDQAIYRFDTDKALGFSPRDAQGNELSSETFLAADGTAASVKNGRVFTFLAAAEGIGDVTIHFDGKISAVGGENLTLVDSKTVKLTPGTASATVTRIVPVLDESGNPVLDGDGNPVTEVAVAKEECAFFAGYVLFSPAPNLFWIIFGCIAGAGLVTVIVLGIKLGWFRRMWKSSNMIFVKRNWGLYLMVLPAFAVILLFSYLPMTGIVLAFKNYTVDGGIFGSEWAGLQNFIDIFTLPGVAFGMLIKNTLILSLLRFVFNFGCSIGLAILFSYLKNNWFKKAVQTISYFPYFISWVVISGMAYLFLSANGGIFNNILETFHMAPIKWYSEPQYWPAILTVTSVWKTVGYGTVIYLAAIASIDPGQYEAAQIDGAGRWQQLLHVTLPGMLPVIGVQIILSLGNLVKDDFDQIYSMTGGNNAYLVSTTEVIGTVVFKAISGGVNGYASATAMSLVQSVTALVIVLFANKIVKKFDVQTLY